MIKRYLSFTGSSDDKYVVKRKARLFFSIATSVMAKFIAISSTFLTIPITLNYLGAENFGVWMVISSVVGVMGFTDLGIGMGLQNALSKAYGLNDQSSSKYYIANSYLLVSCLIIFLILIVVALFSVFKVEYLFKIEDRVGLIDAVDALKYSLLSFFVGMPVALIQRILGGLQKTYIANNLMLVGSVVSLIAIFLAVYLDVGLVGLAVMFILSPTATLLLYSLYFFSKNETYRPNLSNISKKHVSPIVSAGVWTVFVQIIYTAKMNAPIMIVSAYLGLSAVAEYSIAQKLTGLAATMISMALQPLWVVYGEAYYRGDRAWVKNTLKKSIMLVILLSIVAAATFQFFGQSLIIMWLGGGVLPSQMLILGFSLWMVASNINICFAMLLNGTGHFRRQAFYGFLCVAISLALVQGFVNHYGVVGVIFIMFMFSELLRMPFNYFESKRIIGGVKVGSLL